MNLETLNTKIFISLVHLETRLEGHAEMPTGRHLWP